MWRRPKPVQALQGYILHYCCTSRYDWNSSTNAESSSYESTVLPVIPFSQTDIDTTVQTTQQPDKFQSCAREDPLNMNAMILLFRGQRLSKLGGVQSIALHAAFFFYNSGTTRLTTTIICICSVPHNTTAIFATPAASTTRTTRARSPSVNPATPSRMPCGPSKRLLSKAGTKVHALPYCRRGSSCWKGRLRCCRVVEVQPYSTYSYHGRDYYIDIVQFV